MNPDWPVIDARRRCYTEELRRAHATVLNVHEIPSYNINFLPNA